MKKLVYLFFINKRSLKWFWKVMICTKGQYQQAIDAYSSVLSTNKQSSELYYNMGTVIIS
jgi:hypothetical protein